VTQVQQIAVTIMRRANLPTRDESRKIEDRVRRGLKRNSLNLKTVCVTAFLLPIGSPHTGLGGAGLFGFDFRQGFGSQLPALS
jgi:hypothetical protein